LYFVLRTDGQLEIYQKDKVVKKIENIDDVEVGQLNVVAVSK
jgi:hypothetical protein